MLTAPFIEPTYRPCGHFSRCDAGTLRKRGLTETIEHVLLCLARAIDYNLLLYVTAGE